MIDSNDKPQDELFSEFNLDEVVAEEHLCRDISRFFRSALASGAVRQSYGPCVGGSGTDDPHAIDG